MEFRFPINEIFHQPIVEIGHTLLPAGFKGDRRQLWDTISKVTDVVNALGSASANAQGLTRPITSADRLRNSDQQVLYLLIDQSSNQNKGAVTGMLKTGRKALYVFDRDGQHFQVQAPCILDFYVHESRQRSGFGKKIFEYMLQREEVEPSSLAIDRPSDKFLAFLNKHYQLNAPIRQMNNFVVYDGFFPKPAGKDQKNGDSPHRGSNGLQAQILTSPYGRYGAPRPACSMGQIIHNQSSTVSGSEQTGVSVSFPNYFDNTSPTPQRQHPEVNEHGERGHAPPQAAIDAQPLQQNEISATTGDAPISTSDSHQQVIKHQQQQQQQQMSQQQRLAKAASSANYATYENNTSISGANNKYRMVKIPTAVGNGISNDTDEVRLQRLARVNSAPATPEHGDGESNISYWPFATPKQDYVYEKPVQSTCQPTIPAHMHHILQPDQYMLKKQNPPPKMELDRNGRPKNRVLTANPGYHYNSQCTPQYHSQHHMTHHGQQLQRQKTQTQLTKDSDHNMNHYNNNLTSYNFYGPRSSTTLHRTQNMYDMQQLYNDQQLYQQQLEQQYANQQMQQMWHCFQAWMQQQQAQPYDQYAEYHKTQQYTHTSDKTSAQHYYQLPQQMSQQSIHECTPQVQAQTPLQQPARDSQQYQQTAQEEQQCAQTPEELQLQQAQLQQTQLQQAQLQQAQLQQAQLQQAQLQQSQLQQSQLQQQPHQEYQQIQKQSQPEYQQQTKQQQENQEKFVEKQPDQSQVTFPEKLQAQEPTDHDHRSYHNHPKLVEQYKHPIRPCTAPCSYQHSPLVYQQMMPTGYYQPMYQQMQIPGPHSAMQYNNDQLANSQSTSGVSHSVQNVHQPSNAQLQVPMVPSQVSNQSLQHPVPSVSMVAQPTSTPPLNQTQIAQLSPQQQIMYYQKMLSQSYQNQPQGCNMYNPVFGIPPQTQPPPQIPHPQMEGLHSLQNIKESSFEGSEVPASNPNSKVQRKPSELATVEGASSAKKVDKVPVPYPFPIIMKSNLEPLQPSIPPRRESRQEIITEKPPSSIGPRTTTPRQVGIKPSARIANVLLKSTINMANTSSRFDVNANEKNLTGKAHKTPVLQSKMYEHNLHKAPSVNMTAKTETRDFAKRSAAISEFLEQLP